MGAKPSEWRNDFLAQLRERDSKTQPFDAIVETNTRTLAKCGALELQLRIQADDLARVTDDNQRLARELDIAQKEGKLVSALEYRDRIAELEAKLEQTRQELTESYKKKGEHAQKLLDLNELVQAKDEALAHKAAQLQAAEGKIAELTDTVKGHVSTIAERDVTIQVLQDEVQALQLELVTTSAKQQKTESDYEQLLDRWIKKKNEEAQKVNEANLIYESMKKEQQARVIQEHAETIKQRRGSGPSAEKDILGFLDGTGAPNKVELKINIGAGEVISLATTASGKMFSVAGSDKNLTLWDTVSGKRKAILSGASQGLLATAFSSKDDLVLAASNDNATRIYDTRTQRLKHSLTGHIAKVCTAQFASEGQKVTGSHDRTLKVWDLKKGYCSKTLFTFSSCNHLVLTDEGGTGIVSGHVDNHIRFWDTRSGECTNELTGIHTAPVTCLDLSEDCNYLLTQSRDNSLKLIDLRMSQVVSTLGGEGYKTPSNYSSACFGPQGRLVAAGSLDGGVYLWNTQTGKLDRVLKDHGSAVNACTWNLASNTLITGDKEHTVIIWNVL